ncbi:hypothetical protein B0H14DRAFT_3780484 [Mycena olivaceomarginata]|nr:hypothetical protein B0H14DRAFT_3780484 [Mycena olivaceomarginata]
MMPAKPASEKKRKVSKGDKIDKSMFSGPASGSFVHITDIGYEEDQGFTSTGLKGVIAQEMNFIKDFACKHTAQAAKVPKQPKPAPPPWRRTRAANDTSSSNNLPIYKIKPKWEPARSAGERLY